MEGGRAASQEAVPVIQVGDDGADQGGGARGKVSISRDQDRSTEERSGTHPPSLACSYRHVI